MSTGDELLHESAEDLFEDAPCGYLTTRLDGTIVRVNRTFESWTGFDRAELLAGRRLQDLLAPGARIYHETHYAPLLQMQGSVREIAVEFVRANGSRLPALINSVLRRDAGGQPQLIRTTVFDATDRRRYERELLNASRREHEIAQLLQRSLLSGELPSDPRLGLEVVYRPAVAGLEVGGDWYDAFWVGQGEAIGLVVGDVVGRGIEAAATMGQLRSAVRALASTGLAPGPLLDALDAYARRHGVGRMATLIYAQLDLGTRTLRYACAGHPPPLIVSPGAEPYFAWEGRSLPLDAYTSALAPRADATASLSAGSAVVLYTDGVVERASRPLDAGMDLLLREVAARRDDAALGGPVVRALHDSEHPDDRCLLAARLDPSS
ncbi:MAG: phosphoserine phosphatase RsbU/P [Thermoleophilaceae bacterium]|nr:phosphoserine phosphatase RsbU/P [Thermoleophilaceae bacterium]